MIAALHTDLAHRDFTINALARDLRTGELHDPYEGQLDIKHYLVRAVGDPEERFREDPLRMLRAVRMTAELGFHIDRATGQARRFQAMVAAHRKVEPLGVGIGTALNFTHPPPLNAGRVVILLVAGYLATVAADALRHVEVEAVLFAVGRGKSAGRRREVRSFFGD